MVHISSRQKVSSFFINSVVLANNVGGGSFAYAIRGTKEMSRPDNRNDSFIRRAKTGRNQAAFFLSSARIFEGFGRVLPCEPRRILPRLLRKSPFPMSGSSIVVVNVQKTGRKGNSSSDGFQTKNGLPWGQSAAVYGLRIVCYSLSKRISCTVTLLPATLRYR